MMIDDSGLVFVLGIVLAVVGFILVLADIATVGFILLGLGVAAIVWVAATDSSDGRF